MQPEHLLNWQSEQTISECEIITSACPLHSGLLTKKSGVLQMLLSHTGLRSILKVVLQVQVLHMKRLQLSFHKCKYCKYKCCNHSALAARTVSVRVPTAYPRRRIAGRSPDFNIQPGRPCSPGAFLVGLRAMCRRYRKLQRLILRLVQVLVTCCDCGNQTRLQLQAVCKGCCMVPTPERRSGG